MFLFVFFGFSAAAVLFDLVGDPVTDVTHNNSNSEHVDVMSTKWLAEIRPDETLWNGTFASTAGRISVNMASSNVRIIMAVPPMSMKGRFLQLAATVVMLRGDTVSVVFAGVLAVILRTDRVEIYKSMKGGEFDPHVSGGNLVLQGASTVPTGMTRFDINVTGTEPMFMVRVSSAGAVIVGNTVNVADAMAIYRGAFQVYAQWNGRFDVESFLLSDNSTSAPTTTTTATMTTTTRTTTTTTTGAPPADVTVVATTTTTGLMLPSVPSTTTAQTLTSPTTLTTTSLSLSPLADDGDAPLALGLGLGLGLLFLLLIIAVVVFLVRRRRSPAVANSQQSPSSRSSEYGPISVTAPSSDREYKSTLSNLS
ncbi:MAG: hypothetical protein IV100_31190 [Myxococcales bacterium]|nr:hypothetical protein [Myxococcales bacterium]